MLKRIIAILAVSAVWTGSNLEAKVSAEEAKQLDSTLTPLGAIRAGNADGMIPEWTGGITGPQEGYQKGDHHPDPYAGDSSLFTITSANLADYRDKLSPGQAAMFERYPDTWKMQVYPTHRSASFPDFVYKAARGNAETATLTEDGNGVQNAGVTSPFPIPESGLEVIWNHLLRYRGEKLQHTIVQAAPHASGSYLLVKINETILIPYNVEGGTVESVNNRFAYFQQEVTAPPFLAGEILLVHETLDQNKEPRKAWVYNPGQRRVRLAPNVAFDNPGTASDGQRTTDQFDMFNGSPERYDWNLVGRQEVYVPYNAYKVHSKDVTYDEILATGHMNSDLLRYELHRVWVVEATVKSGTSHIYAKRVFYIDEDSWQILVADQYGAKGDIWRVSEAHPINYYDVPMLWDTVIAHYDLVNGRYLVFGMNNQEAIEDFDVNLTKSHFTSGRLKQKGRR
jgi:hypothetical protein